MKRAAFLYSVLLSFFWSFGQEEQGAFTKEYRFETEYQYKNLDEDNALVTFQFTPEKFLKINLSDKGDFILMDAEEGILAEEFTIGKVKVEKIADMPPLQKNNSIKFKRKEEIEYLGYKCNIYHINPGNQTLKFYFEKKESTNFNTLVVKILALRGFQIDETTVPKGRLIAAMELINGGEVELFELANIKEDQKIRFTLKTNE